MSPCSFHSFKNSVTAICNGIMLEHFLNPTEWSCLESEFSKLGVVSSHSSLFASGLGHDFRIVEQVHNRAAEHKLHFFFLMLHATWTFKIGWRTLYIWCARIYIKMTSFPVNSPLSVRQFTLCLLVFLQLFAQSRNAAVRQLSKS